LGASPTEPVGWGLCLLNLIVGGFAYLT